MQCNIVKLAAYDHNRVTTVECFLSQEEYRFNVFKTGYIRLYLELSGRSVSKNNQLHSLYQLPDGRVARLGEIGMCPIF